MDKHARLLLFYERLTAAPTPKTHDEAYALLCDTLNTVEDELSGVQYDPPSWQTDGRLYPPQSDRVYAVPEFPGVLRYGSFKHDTYIRKNGAIEVRLKADGTVQFSKAGADGKGVWQ